MEAEVASVLDPDLVAEDVTKDRESAPPEIWFGAFVSTTVINIVT